MPTSVATETRMVPRLHVARDRDTEMQGLREHLELLMAKIRRQAQTIQDLTVVCETQRDEIDRLRTSC